MKTTNLERIVGSLHTAAAQLELETLARAAVTARLRSPDSEIPAELHDEIEVRFGFQKLCFHSRLGYPYFETKLELCLRGDEVGDYRLISSLDGETVDDYYDVHTHVEWDTF